MDEIKPLNKIVAENPNRSGRKHVVSLLDSFEHKGPNGVHFRMVFVAVPPCQRRGSSSNPKQSVWGLDVVSGNPSFATAVRWANLAIESD